MKNKMIARLCKLLGVSHSSNDWFIINQGLSGASWAGLKTVVQYLNKLKGGQK